MVEAPSLPSPPSTSTGVPGIYTETSAASLLSKAVKSLHTGYEDPVPS